jgi:uncharacterized Tic20 family protein
MTIRPRQSPALPAPAAPGLAAAHGTGTGPGPGGAALPADDASAGDADPGGRAAQWMDGGPPGRGEVRSAMLAYLGVPFTLVVLPLAVYLASLHGRRFARWHAAQALNASVTALLYSVCCFIAGGMLALDSVQVATFIAVPLLVALWVGVLVTVVRAAAAASRGETRELPRWLRLR